MPIRKSHILALLLSGALLPLAGCLHIADSLSRSKELTYVDLAERLTDLEQLALLPEPGETTRQWSTWSRNSRYDEETGRYIDWNANGDGNGIIRREGDWEVLAEMDGPGCIWRIWSARPMDGRIKIILDGNDEPAIDLPFAGLFNGENKPFDYPALVYETKAQGFNCYIPIPYRKSCKILGENPVLPKGARKKQGSWGVFYHIGYTTFPKGTKVPTFRRSLSSKEVAALRKANEYFTNWLGTSPRAPRDDDETLMQTVEAAPGATTPVLTLEGERAITGLEVGFVDPLTPDESAGALRKSLLRITWDDDRTPSVLAPLGDFFGTAPGVNQYKTLPMGMTENGFYSFWFMPFAKRARIELLNQGERPLRLTFSVTHSRLSLPVERYARFHAKWHMDTFLPPEPERAIDWTMLKTEGRGRFCGVMLHIWNPKDIGWWGEGDEKFFVDGEKFPSTYGTGSEDYFGYAWGGVQLFARPFHAQTHNPTHNRGHVSVNRWHIPDNVPFQTSFEGAIENYFGLNEERNMQYSCTAYWYLEPGREDGYTTAPSAAERVGYFDYVYRRIEKGVNHLTIEAIHEIGHTAGTAKITRFTRTGRNQTDEAFDWQWQGASVGDKLSFRLIPVRDPGRYELSIDFLKSAGSAVVQVYLNGKKIGAPVDCRSKEIVFPHRVNFGTHRLTGEPELTFEILEADSPKVDFAFHSVDLAWN